MVQCVPLEVPYFKLSTIGGRAFPVAASQIWNSLPDTVVSASTLRSFQHQLNFFFISTILYLLALYNSGGGEGNLRPRRPPREYLGEYTS